MELHVDYLMNVLPIAGTGMLGVFLVTGVIIAGVSLLNALIVAVSNRNRCRVEQTFRKLETLWDNNDVYKKDV